MSNRRPRRSRIYDLNYNIGENYYKSAIDRLDEKSSRPASVLLLRQSEPPRSRVSQIARDDGIQDDLELARDRASKVIQRETVLDQRTGRRGIELEGDFDSQVSCEETRTNEGKEEWMGSRKSVVEEIEIWLSVPMLDGEGEWEKKRAV